MRGFQHKIDSTWQFGHSGWLMSSFKCDSKKLPLKFKLNIGSNINEFIIFFGKPEKQSSKYIHYDFSDWRAMKMMKIHVKNDKVTKIEIITANNV